MGTPSGVPTRRYHAWRVIAARPPVERFVALHSVVETLVLPGKVVSLTSFAFGERGVLHPDGPGALPDVRIDIAGSEIVWSWTIDVTPRSADASGSYQYTVTRTLSLRGDAPGAAVVSYRMTGSGPDATVRLRPIMPLRDFHELDHAGADAPSCARAGREITLQRGGRTATLLLPRDAQRCGEADWWREFAYGNDRDRGQDWREDLWSPGEWRCGLRAGGAPVTLQVRGGAAAARPATYRSVPATRLERRENGGSAEAQLAVAAEQFLVVRTEEDGYTGTREARSVLAGYPWFTDWGRDTMISLPGLLLLSGRYDEAKSALHLYARRMRNGLLPNCFDDIGAGAVYHTADASLWFMSAVAETLSGGPRSDDDEVLIDAVREVIRAYRQGTDFGIRVDRDGLVIAGDGERPVTWMDARRDGVSFTPRVGKPVELSALWHHGLCAAARLTDRAEEQRAFTQYAEQTRAGMAQFARSGYGLHDVLVADGNGGWRGDGRIRPNQIFALSRAPMCVPHAVAEEVLATVRLHLLTPYGLRTLSPDDPEYRGRYEGTLFERDRAYHQGTVWPWLLGPYVEAMLRVRGRAALADAKAALMPLLAELDHGCVGQLAEVYDGDPPHRSSGCPAQAWSVAEVRRALRLIEDAQ